MIDTVWDALKNIHSRVMVSIETLDSVSKRIERLRDEELQPQLMELIEG